jgi:hypothetical protein
MHAVHVVPDLSTVLLLFAALGLLYPAVTHAQFLCLPIASAPATAHCWVYLVSAFVGYGVAFWLSRLLPPLCCICMSLAGLVVFADSWLYSALPCFAMLCGYRS